VKRAKWLASVALLTGCQWVAGLVDRPSIDPPETQDTGGSPDAGARDALSDAVRDIVDGADEAAPDAEGADVREAGEADVVVWTDLPAAGGGIAAIADGQSRVRVVYVGASGALYATTADGSGPWEAPTKLTAPGFAPATAHLALARELDANGTLDAFVLDTYGKLEAIPFDGQRWQPARILLPDVFPAGAPVAVGAQGVTASPPHSPIPGLDVFTISKDGDLCIAWLDSRGWQGGCGFPHLPVYKNLSPRGTLVTARQEAPKGQNGQLDVFTVDNTGRLVEYWLHDTFQPPDWTLDMSFGDAGFAQASAPLVTGVHGTNTVDVLIVDSS